MSGIGVIIILLHRGPLLGHSAQSGRLAAARALPDFLKVSDLLLKQDPLRFAPKAHRHREREPALRHALQIIKDKRDAA